VLWRRSLIGGVHAVSARPGTFRYTSGFVAIGTNGCCAGDSAVSDRSGWDLGRRTRGLSGVRSRYVTVESYFVTGWTGGG
jgi:hypothetical protein